MSANGHLGLKKDELVDVRPELIEQRLEEPTERVCRILRRLEKRNGHAR